jgi:hypothetical protein
MKRLKAIRREALAGTASADEPAEREGVLA